MVVYIKQHKSQFRDLNITITQCQKNFADCVMVKFELLNCDLCCFMRKSSYCFQRVLAVAILSVRLSVTRVDQSKTMQARITKSLL